MYILIIAICLMILISLSSCKKSKKNIDLTSGFINPVTKNDLFGVQERIEKFGKDLINNTYMQNENFSDLGDSK